MGNISLYKKLNNLPESMKSEVSDFIDFLISKTVGEKHSSKPKPQFGSGKGTFEIAPDFEEPLEDFKEYMDS